MKMTFFILLILVAEDVCADRHSLRDYRTTVSSPGSEFRLYIAAEYIDDKPTGNYNSDTRQYLPKNERMKKLESEYWKRQTDYYQRAELSGKTILELVMCLFTKTGGLHVYQEMTGCELGDDGSTIAYVRHGYNGRDFAYLDTQRWIWIPVVSEAMIITQVWNLPERSQAGEWKNYLTNTCIIQLKKMLAFSRGDLEQRVRPEVKVWGRRRSDGVMKLHCLVYGFHPRAVDVKWVRNGVDDVPADGMSPILPHPDGTYQIRVSAEVPIREGDTYACHVDHSSLEETIEMRLDISAKLNKNLSVIIGFCVAIAVKVITAAAIGVKAWRNHHAS